MWVMRMKQWASELTSGYAAGEEKIAYFAIYHLNAKDPKKTDSLVAVASIKGVRHSIPVFINKDTFLINVGYWRLGVARCCWTENWSCWEAMEVLLCLMWMRGVRSLVYILNMSCRAIPTWSSVFGPVDTNLCHIWKSNVRKVLNKGTLESGLPK